MAEKLRHIRERCEVRKIQQRHPEKHTGQQLDIQGVFLGFCVPADGEHHQRHGDGDDLTRHVQYRVAGYALDTRKISVATTISRTNASNKTTQRSFRPSFEWLGALFTVTHS